MILQNVLIYIKYLYIIFSSIIFISFSLETTLLEQF